MTVEMATMDGPSASQESKSTQQPNLEVVTKSNATVDSNDAAVSETLQLEDSVLESSAPLAATSSNYAYSRSLCSLATFF